MMTDEWNESVLLELSAVSLLIKLGWVTLESTGPNLDLSV